MSEALTVADPWLPQAGESDKAFRAFCKYRDMPVRRLGGVRAGKLGTAEEISLWSRQHNWVARVRAYDAHLRDFATTIRKEEIAEAMTRAAVQDIAILDQTQTLILREITAYLKKALSEEFSEETPSIPIRDLIKLIDYQAKYARLLNGQATEKIEVDNFDTLDIEKLRELKEELNK